MCFILINRYDADFCVFWTRCDWNDWHFLFFVSFLPGSVHIKQKLSYKNRYLKAGLLRGACVISVSCFLAILTIRVLENINNDVRYLVQLKAWSTSMTLACSQFNSVAFVIILQTLFKTLCFIYWCWDTKLQNQPTKRLIFNRNTQRTGRSEEKYYMRRIIKHADTSQMKSAKLSPVRRNMLWRIG